MGQDGKSTGLSPGAEVGDKDAGVPLPDEDHVSKQLETERGTAGDSFDDKFDDNPETSSRFLLTNVDAGGAAEGSGESIDEDNNVPHDSFSIFYVAKTWNEYILPISVFGLQVLILVLIGINLLQTNNSQLSNRWNVPADVHPSVRISQYIACLVSVFTADDFVSGILLSCQVITDKSQSVHEGTNVGISKKWEISNLMRLLEGLLVILVSFLFIIQSREAIELWLNFAGVTFVGQLDDVAFLMAKNDFFGLTGRHLAERVVRLCIWRAGRSRMDSTKTRTKRVLVCTALAGILFLGLSIIAQDQSSGKYSCRSITLTVGEARYDSHWARHFSGVYTRSTDRKYNGRPIYVHTQQDTHVLSYCGGNVLRWSVTGEWTDSNVDCGDFTLMSEKTRSYDITEIDALRLYNNEEGDAHIKCNDCRPSLGRQDCSWHGECNTTSLSCDCSPGYFGDSCQFSGPCTELQMNAEFHGIEFGWEKSFHLLRNEGEPVMFYQRPVYIQRLSPAGIFGIVIFDGGRWDVARSDHITSLGEEGSATEEKLAYHLANEFTIQELWDTPGFYISDPTTFSSPVHVPFRAWLSYSDSHIGRLGENEFTFQCSDCATSCESEDAGSCMGHDGHCNADLCLPQKKEMNASSVYRCKCEPGFMGPHCNVYPVEGTLSLYLDYGTGVCGVCGQENIWVGLKSLDGISNYCTTLPKSQPLVFQNSNGTSSNTQVAIMLNITHFSVIASSDIVDGKDLCKEREGYFVIDSFQRSLSEERIHLDYAISLDGVNSVPAMMVDPEEIDCPKTIDIAQSDCDSNPMGVYVGNGNAGGTPFHLRRAWVHINLRVTPFKESL
mmetsp:Transcript_4257/g.8827  ORF Transcript_4257/g.8827 Transcript_4257/m.8827 type:complete len:837 (+) Transcript_4257:208-2718(+)